MSHRDNTSAIRELAIFLNAYREIGGQGSSAESRMPNRPFSEAPNLNYYEVAQNIMPILPYLAQPKGGPPFPNL